MGVDLSISLPIILIVLFFLLAIRVPIGTSLGLLGVLGLCFFAGPEIALKQMGLLLLSIPVKFILLAVPLFIFMAEIVIFTGIAEDAYRTMDSLFSGVAGGLALGTVGAGVVFAAVTGSSVASTATIGPVAVREMIERGYKKSLASGVVACAGGLAILIPPSIPLIIYGYLAEVSVAKLFMAGVIPGLVLAACFAVVILIWTRLDPSVGPSIHTVASLKERIFPVVKLWPFIMLAIIVLGSIYRGVATPTEAAAVGVLGSIVLSLVFRKFSVKKFYAALLSTAKTTGFIMFILIGTLTFVFLLNYLRIPTIITQGISQSNIPPLALITLVMLVMFGLGCILDPMSLLIVIVSVMQPSLLIAGFDPVWIGVMLTLNCEMALVTPPVAMSLFVAHAIGKPYGVTFGDVVRGIAPFLLADWAVIILMIAFPVAVLWLPSTLS